MELSRTSRTELSRIYNHANHHDMRGSSRPRSLCDGPLLVLCIAPCSSLIFLRIAGFEPRPPTDIGCSNYSTSSEIPPAHTRYAPPLFARPTKNGRFRPGQKRLGFDRATAVKSPFLPLDATAMFDKRHELGGFHCPDRWSEPIATIVCSSQPVRYRTSVMELRWSLCLGWRRC